MKKNLLKAIIVAVFALVAAVTIYTSQKSEVSLSDLAIKNAEALAGSEFFDSNCDGSWNKECCFCIGIHYTYARPASNNVCELKTGCNHYN